MSLSGDDYRSIYDKTMHQLNNTLNVLIVDQNIEELERTADLLSKTEIFKVYKAYTYPRAQKEIALYTTLLATA
ncbi:MAG: hypothetical protein GF401_20315 [Chitinivibrionales bacterium]|nr:hypothetical protein [Chitinivibrionales bacterium]